MFKFLADRQIASREKKELSAAIETLVEESRLSWRFIIFTSLAAMIATLGIIMENVTILIGAMLIAPLLVPVISLSIGVGSGSLKLIGHSIKSLLLGLALALAAAAGTALLVSNNLIETLTSPTGIFWGFTDTYSYGLVAFLSGIVAVYSWLKPKSNHILPGAAIAVALIPPVAFVGIILAALEPSVIIDTMQLIIINLIGIFLGGLMTFAIFALVSKRPTEDVGKQVDVEVEKDVKKKSA